MVIGPTQSDLWFQRGEDCHRPCVRSLSARHQDGVSLYAGYVDLRTVLLGGDVIYAAGM